ncbi:MAG: formyltetrahydrofolate deformylase [Mycobacterium sp.]|nr:formyltetrahydrofolate deformylase [Mycobacterium sp.]
MAAVRTFLPVAGVNIVSLDQHPTEQSGGTLLTEAAKPKRVVPDMSVAMVISNHADLADQVRPFSAPFLHVPVTNDIRVEAERRQLQVFRGTRI